MYQESGYSRKRDSRGKPCCDQCGIGVDVCSGDMVVLSNDTWSKIADTFELLCVQCIEGRLGRKINQFDFPLIPVSIYRNKEKELLRDIVCNQAFFAKYKIKFHNYPVSEWNPQESSARKR